MPASGVAFQELPIIGAAITFVLALIISLIFALAFTCGGHDSEERTRHAAARPDNETASRTTHNFRSTFPSGTATEPFSLAMPYASRVMLYMNTNVAITRVAAAVTCPDAMALSVPYDSLAKVRTSSPQQVAESPPLLQAPLGCHHELKTPPFSLPSQRLGYELRAIQEVQRWNCELCSVCVGHRAAKRSRNKLRGGADAQISPNNDFFSLLRRDMVSRRACGWVTCSLLETRCRGRRPEARPEQTRNVVRSKRRTTHSSA